MHYTPLDTGTRHADAGAKPATGGGGGSGGGGGGASGGDEPLITGATASEDRTARNQRSWEDDSNWRGLRCCGGTETCGFIYYGYADDRLCVRRRHVRCWRALRCCEARGGCVGTVNVGHRWGWPLLALFVLVFLLGEGVSWAVSFFNARL